MSLSRLCMRSLVKPSYRKIQTRRSFSSSRCGPDVFTAAGSMFILQGVLAGTVMLLEEVTDRASKRIKKVTDRASKRIEELDKKYWSWQR